jgi:flagellar protein FlaG
MVNRIGDTSQKGAGAARGVEDGKAKVEKAEGALSPNAVGRKGDHNQETGTRPLAPAEASAFVNEVNDFLATANNVSLEFQVHEGTGRTVIHILDKETGEVIRAIPSEKLLEMAAKIEEMSGILFDKTQ